MHSIIKKIKEYFYPTIKIELISCKRLRNNREGFTIAIDDGYCAYKADMNINGSYSIDNLFEIIQKVVKKKSKIPQEE